MSASDTENAVFRFTPPEGVAMEFVTVPADACSLDGADVVCPWNGSTMAVILAVPAATLGDTITVKGTVTSDTGTSTSSGSETVVPSSAVRLDVTVDRTTVGFNQPVTFTQTITNDGPATAEDVRFFPTVTGSGFTNIQLMGFTESCSLDDTTTPPACEMSQLDVGDSATLVWKGIPTASLGYDVQLFSTSEESALPDPQLTHFDITVLPKSSGGGGGSGSDLPPTNEDDDSGGGCNAAGGGSPFALIVVGAIGIAGLARRRRTARPARARAA